MGLEGEEHRGSVEDRVDGVHRRGDGEGAEELAGDQGSGDGESQTHEGADSESGSAKLPLWWEARFEGGQEVGFCRAGGDEAFVQGALEVLPQSGRELAPFHVFVDVNVCEDGKETGAGDACGGDEGRCVGAGGRFGGGSSGGGGGGGGQPNPVR